MYEKYLVAHPELMTKIQNLIVTQSDLSELDQSLLKIIKNKQIDAHSKWLLYQRLLHKHFKRGGERTPIKTAVEDESTKPVETAGKKGKIREMKKPGSSKIADSSTQTDSPPSVSNTGSDLSIEGEQIRAIKRKRGGVSMETQTEPVETRTENSTQTDNKFYETVFEHPGNIKIEPDIAEGAVRGNLTLEEFMKHLLSQEVPDQDIRDFKVRRSTVGKPYRVYENVKTGETVTIDAEQAEGVLREEEAVSETKPVVKREKKTQKKVEKNKWIILD